MRIYGLDFTSAPSKKKPIVVAVGQVTEQDSRQPRLELRTLMRIDSLDGFERCLRQPGPWVAALDLPFGQPRRVIEALSWPTDWSSLVDSIARRPREAFEEALLRYKANRPKGDKEHLRLTDRFAGSPSSMKLYGIPLAKMFFEGTTRIAASAADVVPCCRRRSDRTILEVYPALVARAVVGTQSYKSEASKTQTEERRDARRRIVAALGDEKIRTLYGLRVELGEHLAGEMIEDPRGDVLDASLAAVQAAWSWGQRDRNFGIPLAADPLEGWIADPATTLPGTR